MSRSKIAPLPPLPAGGRLLRKPVPAPAPAENQAPPKPFRLTIEGQLASNGQIAFIRVQAEADPAVGMISPAEAEYIAHRTLFAPPAVVMRPGTPGTDAPPPDASTAAREAAAE